MHVPPNVAANQGQITQAIENFMPNTLIGSVQSVVDRTFWAKDQQILGRRSTAVTLRSQHFSFRLQHKGSGKGEFGNK